MSRTIEIDEMADSITSMVIEWVDGGIKMNTDWRTGLARVIQLRLDRLATPAVERQEPVGCEHRRQMWNLTGGGHCADCGSPVGNSTASHPVEQPAPVSVVPDGWKLVPIEPTGVMKDTGAFSALPVSCANAWTAGDVWRAMVKAAPEYRLDKLKELNQ